MRLIPTLALAFLTGIAATALASGQTAAPPPVLSTHTENPVKSPPDAGAQAVHKVTTTPATANPYANDQVITLPSAITPGETVTLKWLFTGDKVTLSGGRFGKGVVVTGRQSITDKPTATTRYTFDVAYKGDAPVGTTGQREIRPLHARYTADVNVFHMPPTKPYNASLGWHVNYQSGWETVNVPTAEIKQDGLVFFQPEDDSIERVAVSVLPVKDMTVDQLLKNVQKEMPAHYEEVKILSCDSITCCNAPAFLTRFTGMDESHPGTRTESVIVVFVQGGMGYVISGRTAAAQYRSHGPILERLVRSFTLRNQAGNASAANIKTVSDRLR